MRKNPRRTSFGAFWLKSCILDLRFARYLRFGRHFSFITGFDEFSDGVFLKLFVKNH